MGRIINPFCDRCGRISPRWLNANRHHAGFIMGRACCCKKKICPDIELIVTGGPIEVAGGTETTCDEVPDAPDWDGTLVVTGSDPCTYCPDLPSPPPQYYCFEGNVVHPFDSAYKCLTRKTDLDGNVYWDFELALRFNQGPFINASSGGTRWRLHGTSPVGQYDAVNTDEGGPNDINSPAYLTIAEVV